MLPAPASRAARPRFLPPGALWAGLLVLAALLAPLSACQEASTKVDCDQLLGDGKYDDVIKHCDNPYQRASAYLGKSGFDTFSLIESTAPNGKVAGLLGLTAANVNQKRLYINQAINEVKNPKGGNQAFVLLLASFLGLAVTSEQFLDNGIVDAAGTVDPAKVLDDILEDTETAGALGFDPAGSLPNLAIYPSLAPPYISVVSGGVPYVVDCSADLVDPKCDTDPETIVYDDSDGSGIVLPAATESLNSAAVVAGVLSYSATGFVIQLGDFDLGTLATVAQDPVVSFLGQAESGGVFDIGLAGYLGYLRIADVELANAAGSTGGTDVTEQIDALVTQFDNGATCASAATVGAVTNELYAFYRQAPGTSAQPIAGTPGAGAFAASSLVPRTDLPAIDTVLSAVFPANTAFALAHYKVLYPTVDALSAFDTTLATPRVDLAPATFATRFGEIPQLAPAAMQAGDGNVTFLEVLCAAD